MLKVNVMETSKQVWPQPQIQNFIELLAQLRRDIAAFERSTEGETYRECCARVRVDDSLIDAIRGLGEIQSEYLYDNVLSDEI